MSAAWYVHPTAGVQVLRDSLIGLSARLPVLGEHASKWAKPPSKHFVNVLGAVFLQRLKFAGHCFVNKRQEPSVQILHLCAKDAPIGVKAGIGPVIAVAKARSWVGLLNGKRARGKTTLMRSSCVDGIALNRCFPKD